MTTNNNNLARAQQPTPTPEQNAAQLQLILAEYNETRADQRDGRRERNGSLLALVATLGALFWVVIGQQWLWALLVVPYLTSASAWVFLSVERLNNLQNEFIKEDLTPAGSRLAGRRVFNWQVMPERHQFRAPRRLLALALQLVAFVVAGAAATAIGLLATPSWALWIAVPIALFNVVLLWIVGVWAYREVWL
ncbi:MAG TPA: hypothetical protein VFS21_33250 [Roseiflexaceae bacterium]|nr:hypothetical protein [Roseiflexaceae bacterium]